MSQQLEKDLERVLRNAGESAPKPDADVLGQITARGHRRTRRRVQAGAALLAAVVAVGLVGVAVGIGRPSANDPAGRTIRIDNHGETADMGKAENVWPDAVHRIPAKLPDGRKILPVTFLDARTLLIATWGSFEKTDAFYRYDIKTRELDEITKVTSPGYAGNVTAAGGWVVWSINDETRKEPGTEIWGAPLTGGAARKLAVAPGKVGPDVLAVSDGTIHWSSAADDQSVYSQPLAGGEPTAIPDTKGHHIVSWPWVGTPGPSDEAGKEVEFLWRTLRNVETGEVREAKARPGVWSCGITWCAGSDKDKHYAERRNGKDRKEIEVALDTFSAARPLPLRDRFLISMGLDVLDLKTGKTGRLATAGGSFRMVTDDRLHYSYVTGGLQVIDLAAIK